MGMLIDGKWSYEGRQPDPKGRFVRTETVFRGQITANGASGFAAEPGRYHLYVSLACPWAHRTLIVRKLKRLEQAIGLSVVDSFMGEEGWQFTGNPGAIPDSVFGKEYIREVYLEADPAYTGRCSVPVLWDKQRHTIVNNESREIIRMFDVACDAMGDPAVTFCPEPLRGKIDETISAIYEPINNGVYKAGFARTQAAHEEAVRTLFAALEQWEQVLGQQRYLCGDTITEADWCLFTTLIRFDVVYHTHFKCNLRRIVDYPNLWNYLKELYQVPGVAETCNVEHIKNHYFASHEMINPFRIVPVGPIVNFAEPHDRAAKFQPSK